MSESHELAAAPDQEGSGLDISPISRPKDGSDLVNCHFSLNPSVLTGLVRPVVTEVVQETRLYDRLSIVEASLHKLQTAVEQKADVRRLQALDSALHALVQQVQQKAEQKLVMDVGVHLARLEESVSWKVERAAFEELSTSVQQLGHLAAQKAELAALSRVQATTHRLQQQATEQQKTLQEALGALRELESQHLPQQLARQREQQQKALQQLRQLQDALPQKAEQRAVDLVAAAVRQVDAAVGQKAGQAAVQELRCILNDLRFQLDGKAEQLQLDRLVGELQRLGQQLAFKAEAPDLGEAAAQLALLHQQLAQKADLQTLSEAKSRLTALEAALGRKLERSELPSLLPLGLTELSELREAERRGVAEMQQALERLRQELRAELGQGAGEQLKQAVGLKAEHAALAHHVTELERRLQHVIEQFRQKPEQLSYVDSTASTHTLEAAGSARDALGPKSMLPMPVFGVDSPTGSQASAQAPVGRAVRSKSAGQAGSAVRVVKAHLSGGWQARQ